MMIRICPEHYWMKHKKVAFKHKKISGNTSALICQNNQTPSCDETNQKIPDNSWSNQRCQQLVVAIYESPRRTLICFDTRVFYPKDHILWTLWTDFLVLMLNLCTIFSLHRYKISRSQRHQLRITVSFFQPTIIISIFSAEDNNQDFPPPPIGLLLPPWSWWQRLLPVASVISSSCAHIIGLR